MALTTSFSGISLRPPRPLLPACSGRGATTAATLRFPGGSKPHGRIRLKREHRGGTGRLAGSPPSRPLVVRCEASDGRITQQEFTEMAWQGIVSSPDIAKENKHQKVETEHLMKALLEQNNGLARRIFSKAAVDNTRLLEATDKFIQQHSKPRVQLVSESMFDQLLHKFPNKSEHAGFDYEQSALWSPLIKRNAFLSSPGKVITDHGMLEKAGSIMDEERCKRHEACFTVYFSDGLFSPLNFGAFPRERQCTTL